jgi:hypothetical protein
MTSFFPKRRSFGQFRILVFFFKGKKKERGREGNQGGFSHLLRLVWGGRSHPQALEDGPATLKGKKKQKQKQKNGFGLLGVAGPPPMACGWL